MAKCAQALLFSFKIIQKRNKNKKWPNTVSLRLEADDYVTVLSLLCNVMCILLLVTLVQYFVHGLDQASGSP